MRFGLAFVLLLGAAPAFADVSLPAGKAAALDLTHADRDDETFRGWAVKWAKSHHATVVRWGWAQLDDDAQPERFAKLCNLHADQDHSIWLLVEDTPGKRWSIDSGGNCELPDGALEWERQPPTSLEARFADPPTYFTEWLALRGGQLVPVKRIITGYEESDTACTKVIDDFERQEETCTYDVDNAQPRARAALFLVGKKGGRYRKVLSGRADAVSDFDVFARDTHDGRTATVRLARAAVAGEALEVWTERWAAPMGWRATWDGARWRLTGILEAPDEQPRISGDAHSMTIAIDPRGPNPHGRSALTIVAVSVDGKSRVATSDLDVHDLQTVGSTLGPFSSEAHAE